MAAFPYHQPQFLLANSPREMWSCYLPSANAPPEVPAATGAKALESRISSLDTANLDLSSPLVVDSTSAEGVPQMERHLEKTKNRDAISLSSDQSKEVADPKKRKCRRQKKEQAKMIPEPPTGFIHVRARRGQATDSHSIAERVRREKISQRMKLLQSLVPGCDKITGKAQVLDEITNYVRSLQYQVEFLSMRLALLNPTLHDLDEECSGGHLEQQLQGIRKHGTCHKLHCQCNILYFKQVRFNDETSTRPLRSTPWRTTLRIFHCMAKTPLIPCLSQGNGTCLLMQVDDQRILEWSEKRRTSHHARAHSLPGNLATFLI